VEINKECSLQRSFVESKTECPPSNRTTRTQSSGEDWVNAKDSAPDKLTERSLLESTSRSSIVEESGVTSTTVASNKYGTRPIPQSTESGLPGGFSAALHPLSSDITSTKDIVMFLLMVRRFGLDKAISLICELDQPLPHHLRLAIDIYVNSPSHCANSTPDLPLQKS